jgi:hypothetical protein
MPGKPFLVTWYWATRSGVIEELVAVWWMTIDRIAPSGRVE